MVGPGSASLCTVMDRDLRMEALGGPAAPMLAGDPTLGHLAGQTESVRLSLLVTGTTYRSPGPLAKIVATLDVLAEPGDPRPGCRLVRTRPPAAAAGRDGTRHELDVLRRHCDDVGRDYDEIEKTMVNGINGADPVADTDGFVRQMAEYAALGISLVTLTPPTHDPVGRTTQVREDVPARLAEL